MAGKQPRDTRDTIGENDGEPVMNATGTVLEEDKIIVCGKFVYDLERNKIIEEIKKGSIVYFAEDTNREVSGENQNKGSQTQRGE